MLYNRKETKKIRVGDKYIGGDSTITVQSMCNTDTRNVVATVNQIIRFEDAGCDIVRVAVPDLEAAAAIKEIKKAIHIPLVADIHFDYRLALESIINGADKIRLNPGNIGDDERVKKVTQLAKEREVPIRIGINSGSIEKEIINKYGHPCAKGMVESANRHIDILNKLDFDNIIISLKASTVKLTIEAYKEMAKVSDYPLHIGVTEAGTSYAGTIKSAVGIGSLLSQGIGDTIRVSLTSDPVEEVIAGIEILKSLDLINYGVEFISCPTCGRTQIDLIPIANEIERALKNVKKKIRVAVMGCAVNGPGEAREADIGIAGGNGCALLFKKGEIISKIPQEDIVKELLEEIKNM